MAALANERVVGVAAGGSQSLALTAKGALFSFGSGGNGGNGRLGHGDWVHQLRPKQAVAVL